jgi:hypothetical protein
LSLAARVPILAAAARWSATHIDARLFGRHDGVFAVATRDGSRAIARTFSAPRRSYLIAVEPAVIATDALARGASPAPGVVLPDAQVDPAVLFERLERLGVTISVA